MRDKIKTEVQDIFRKVFSDDSIEIRDDMVAGDVELWDSLTHSLMIDEVETHFNVKFGIREIIKMKNTGNMLDLLVVKLS